MSIVRLYETDKSAFNRLLDQAVEMDVMPESTALAKAEASYVDVVNRELRAKSSLSRHFQDVFAENREYMSHYGNRHDATMLRLLEENKLCKAINRQYIGMVKYHYADSATKINEKTTVGGACNPSPCMTFRLPSNHDLDVAHKFYEIDGRPPKHVASSVAKGFKKSFGTFTGKKNFSVSFAIDTIEFSYEMALLDEQRAIKFLLIKMIGLLRNHSIEWMQEKMRIVQQKRTETEGDIIRYYQDRTFEDRHDPEWKRRSEWLSMQYQLNKTQQERELFWLSQADEESFLWEEIIAVRFEDEKWCGLGSGNVLGSEPSSDADKERDNEKTKNKMEQLREKMRAARLAKFT